MLTLENILDRNNLNRAYKAVVANKGSAGVDGMEVGDLLGHLKTHGAALVQSITEGQYRPSPVRRVLIPKENGQTRPLGIPTVVDRMVQQAVAQMLVEEYESVFSDGSHGFRPGRSCSTAMDQALRYANEGYKWVVDLDLAKFLVHLGSPWNAALTFKKKSGRLPPRKKSSAHSQFQADSSY